MWVKPVCEYTVTRDNINRSHLSLVPTYHCKVCFAFIHIRILSIKVENTDEKSTKILCSNYAIKIIFIFLITNGEKKRLLRGYIIIWELGNKEEKISNMTCVKYSNIHIHVLSIEFCNKILIVNIVNMRISCEKYYSEL